MPGLADVPACDGKRRRTHHAAADFADVKQLYPPCFWSMLLDYRRCCCFCDRCSHLIDFQVYTASTKITSNFGTLIMIFLSLLECEKLATRLSVYAAENINTLQILCLWGLAGSLSVRSVCMDLWGCLRITLVLKVGITYSSVNLSLFYYGSGISLSRGVFTEGVTGLYCMYSRLPSLYSARCASLPWASRTSSSRSWTMLGRDKTRRLLHSNMSNYLMAFLNSFCNLWPCMVAFLLSILEMAALGRIKVHLIPHPRTFSQINRPVTLYIPSISKWDAGCGILEIIWLCGMKDLGNSIMPAEFLCKIQ